MDHLEDEEAEEMEARERELLARHHGVMTNPRFRPRADGDRSPDGGAPSGPT
jgi:hypothetical protein